MIVLDTNVLIAAHRSDHGHHAIAQPWLTDLGRSGRAFGIPSSVWAAFVRLTTDPRIYSPGATPEEAFAFVNAVAAQPGYRAIEPGPLHLGIAENLCRAADVRGKLVPDAFLAAVAIESAATIASFDRDLARFDGLDWIIPAAP